MSGSFSVTDDEFEKKVLQAKTPVMVDFWAPWCGPCVSIAPTLEELAQEYHGKILVAKMNVDENANIPANYGVRSIPYIAVFKNGEVVDSLVGAHPKARLKQMVDKSIM